MRALLMADPNRLKHLALPLELCPWLGACFMAGLVLTARLVARLHLLHLELHCLMELRMMVVSLLFMVVPQPMVLNFVILL